MKQEAFMKGFLAEMDKLALLPAIIGAVKAATPAVLSGAKSVLGMKAAETGLSAAGKIGKKLTGDTDPSKAVAAGKA